MDNGNEGRVKGGHNMMSKDHDRLARRPSTERSASASVRKPKRSRSRAGSTADRETTTGRGLASPTADRRGGCAQSLTLLASGLGRGAAQAFLHVRLGRFRIAFADAQQLVRKHPLQAVLVGVGLGYILSRTKVR